MKRILIAAGVAVAVVLVVIGLMLNAGVKARTGAEQGAQRFVDETIPKILQNWSVKELRDHSASEFLSRATPEQFESTMNALRKELGPMAGYEGSKVQGTAEVQLDDGSSAVAVFLTANAKFDKGSANVDLGLIYKDGRWQFSRFFPSVSR